MALIFGSDETRHILAQDRANRRAEEDDHAIEHCPGCGIEWETALDGGKSEMKNWVSAPPDVQSHFYDCGSGDLHIECGHCGTKFVIDYDNF